MVIVKLGGSLFNSPLLPICLDKLATLSQCESIIIVPGGGPFADQITQAQQKYKFDDAHAHHMALLAMSQFGILLLSLCEQAIPLSYPTQKPFKPQEKMLSIWLPDNHLLEEKQIKQNWETTSDSLALWLAQQLKPKKLTLLKHQVQHYNSIRMLSKIGTLDLAFPKQYNEAEVVTELFDVTQITDYSLAPPKQVLVP